MVRKTIARYLTQPAVALLARTHMTPTTITWLGFLLALCAGALIAMGYLLAAGIVVLLAGYFDILDGALARRINQTTRFGAVFDSTVDRISESTTLLGIMVLFLSRGEPPWTIILVGVALPSSLLVSYIRARAEALNIDSQVGIFTRAERVVILSLGLLINQVLIALAIVTALSIITVIQRLVNVYQQTKRKL